jgi:hypothetical protein
LVNQGKGSLFKRKDDKYFIYVPKKVVEDTAFPFELNSSVKVKVSFTPDKKKKEILVEEL